MKKSDLAVMKVAELRKLGSQNGVSLPAGMKKTDIVAALSKALRGGPGQSADPCTAPENPGPAQCESFVPETGMKQEMEESKFHTGPAHFEPGWGLPTEIPHSYEDDRIALMVRDPHWAYSYWEVTQRKLDAARAELGDAGHAAQLALRLYDVTDVVFDGTNAHRHLDFGIYERVGDWYMDAVKPGRSFVVDLGLKARDGRFVTLARSNAVNTPRDGVSDVTDEEWVIADRDFERIFSLSGGYGIGLSSADIALAAGGSLPFGIASPGISSLALMSPAMKRQRGFWYVLNTELIVYGATEPDAKVTVQGRQVTLRPDGTFTLRFALPDGTQDIPVSFTSADEVDTGWVTPEVTRQTH